MIDIRGLHKRYAGRVVLAGVEGTVEKGAIVALLGPSGSGKTTLLRCLNGLSSFDAGTVTIAGHALDAGPRRAGLDQLRSDVGFLFQDFQLFPHLSVLDNITLAPRVVKKLSRAAAEEQAVRWLERVGLADKAASPPTELSGGQKQRVALARALAQGVSVLLLDEPTSALDPEMRDEVRTVLADVVRAASAERPLTLLLSTHDLRLASNLASELWVLDGGAVVERGTPEELLNGAKSRVAREYFARLRAN